MIKIKEIKMRDNTGISGRGVLCLTKHVLKSVNLSGL